MKDLTSRLNETPRHFFIYMHGKALYSQLIKLFSETISCLINTSNCCSLWTPATSTEGGKTKGSLVFLYEFLIMCLNG